MVPEDEVAGIGVDGGTSENKILHFQFLSLL